MRLFIPILFTGFIAFISCDNNDSSFAPLVSGQGGSLARFAIAGNTLYVVSDRDLKSFDISNANDVRQVSNTEIGFNIETIFPYNNYLFIGSVDAMYIYDISDPHTPVRKSIYTHATTCDPVVVQGNYAYVSLRAATECRGNAVNTVEKVDISDVNNPTQEVVTTDVISPYGLGIRDNVLYVCQGSNGLRLFNSSDLTTIDNLSPHSYDVIVDGNYLILTGNEGIYQYDIQEPTSPVELSLIKVVQD